jgi:hypothetical protein
MYLDEISVKEGLSLLPLLEILSDLLHRYSKHDPSLQQPIRTVLSLNDPQKYKYFFEFLISN